MKKIENLWLKKHIQDWIKATEKSEEESTFLGYDKDGCAIYRNAVDDLIDHWEKKVWEIKLLGKTFRGKFLELDKGEFKYFDILNHNELLPMFTIECGSPDFFFFYGVPIQEANIDIEDDYGLKVHFFIHRNEFYISAHPATFTCIE